ncbi:MAG: hypothetical protein EHM20_17055 [Alphaproteobacteria bacterium]|nr:MAG: hypothetical protein EHM20_17055 [Alphaproteobacteria bacterium]
MNIKERAIYLLITFLISFLSIRNGLTKETAPSPVPAKKSWHLSLGYGIAIKNNLRKDNEFSNSAADILLKHIPLAQVGWGPLSVGAQGFTANLIGNREVGGFLNINRLGDRYYSQGMENRKDSWFFGAGLKYNKFLFMFARDIDGRSHGLRFSANYNALYPIGEKIFTRSSVGLECFSKSYSEYYYGVRSNEATLNRLEYHPKAYCAPGASFFPGYKMSDKLSLLVGLSLKLVPATVRLSPTTNGDWLEAALISGVTWKF